MKKKDIFIILFTLIGILLFSYLFYTFRVVLEVIYAEAM